MDSETSLSSLPPPQSIPASPSLGSRKRSFHEVDGVVMPPPSPKRPVTSDPSDNQENRDPSVSTLNKDTASPPNRQFVSVEIPSSGCPQASIMEGVRQSSTVDMSSLPSHPQQPGAGTPVQNDASSTPAAKKRKLSPASQQAKQQEKEAKDQDRLQEKQRKEEEKRLKEEEKKKREAAREEEKRAKEEERKKREAEREEKRKAKEEEKAAKEAAKEEEKRRKEEEKLKKERAQPKLNSFFAKPRLPSSTAGGSSPSKATPNPDSIAEPSQSTQSDYEKAFPEFFLQSHTTVAPLHRFERDSEALRHVRDSIDRFLPPNDGAAHQHLPFRPSEIFHMIPFTRRRGRHSKSVKEILQAIQTASGSSEPGVNLETNSATNPLKHLRSITMKSLKFGEDVRPPYQGTFTRAVPEPSAKKLCRNPYYRGLPDVNYDYDSEAEWEEPEEGEDLDSEEEEESDEGEDDMDGFLDDEDDALAGGKRRLIVGDLEPVCSGIQWAFDGVDADMQAYQIQTISDVVKFPIDPFSGAYWQKPRAEPASAKGRGVPLFSNQTLDSFRAKPSTDGPAVGSAVPPASTKAKRPFPPELLPEFKEAVDGSDLSKIGLVEILKKKFPKVSKDTLKITLDEVAVRVGVKEIEKKWVCR